MVRGGYVCLQDKVKFSGVFKQPSAELATMRCIMFAICQVNVIIQCTLVINHYPDLYPPQFQYY